MAKLPTAEDLGQTPSPRPPREVASYQATTGMEGAVGDALMRSGAEVGQAAETFAVVKERQDMLRAEDAYNKLRQKQIDMTYGKDGFANLKGGNAVNQPLMKDFGGAFDVVAANLATGLDNDYQRRLFQKRSEVAGLQLREDITRHVATESRVYEHAVTDAGVKTEVQNAGLAGGNEAQFQMAVGRAFALIDAYGEHNGHKADSPVTVLAKQQAVDQANTLRVKTVMNTDPLAAEKLYGQVKGTLNATTRVVLEHELNVAVKPVKAKFDAERAMTPADAEKLTTTLEVKGDAGVQGVARDIIAPPGDKNSRTFFDQTMRSGGSEPVVPKNTQIERDEKRISLLRAELAAPSNDQNDRRMISQEIADTEARLVKLRAEPERAGTTPVSVGSTGAPTRVRDTRAQLGNWVANAERYAQETYPNDPAYRDMVIQNVKGKVATIVQMQDGVQRQAQGQLIQAIVGMNNAPPPTTTAELFSIPGARDAFTLMDEGAQRGILSLLDHNARTASGENVRSNPAVMQNLFNRIHAEENDPTKIRSITQLAPYFAPDANGRIQLNRGDYDWMGREIEKSRNPEGNGFMRDVNNVRNTAVRQMKAGIVGRMLTDAQPEKLEEAAYAFNLELDKKIDAYRKEGKDPRLLLTPGTPDYVLTPGHVQSFLQSPQAALGDAANSARKSQYEAGKEYTFRQGKMKFKGGDASVQANWETVK